MERWDVWFVPDVENITDTQIPGQVKSRNTSVLLTIYSWEKISINTGYIKINWLDIKFTNIAEWMRVANFINKIKWNQLKNHPDQKWKYYFKNGWDLEVDDSNRTLRKNFKPTDTDILDDNTIRDKYPTIYKNKKFLNYLNSL
jgi:hypothetical protein